MICIYNNKNTELLAIVPPTIEEFTKKPLRYFPKFDADIMTLSEIKFSFPIFENGKLREKTRYELIIDETETLNIGEIIVDNKIITVEIPNGLYVPQWNNTEWLESAADLEIELILRHKIIEKNKEVNSYTISNFVNKELENELKELEKKHSDITAKIFFEEAINE